MSEFSLELQLALVLGNQAMAKKKSAGRKRKQPKFPDHLYALECLECNTIIMSLRRHDMVWCECGKVAVDGGLDYWKVTAENPNKIKSIKIKTI